MKKTVQIITTIILFIGLIGTSAAKAQIPTLIHSSTYKAHGAGVSGMPIINVDIPAGNNRMMLLHILIERNHESNYSNLGFIDNNNNWPSVANVRVGEVMMKSLFSGHIYSYQNNPSEVYFTLEYPTLYLGDADGLPTGPTSITITNISLPKENSDEIAVLVSVFENVKTISNRLDDEVKKNISEEAFLSVSGSHVSVPEGRNIADVTYIGIGGISQEIPLTYSNGWTSPTTMGEVVYNTSVPYYGNGPEAYGEPDGISTRLTYRNYTNTNTPPSYTLSKGNSTKAELGYGQLYALLPFAKPSISGTVYRDNNGLLEGVNGGGTGGGFYSSSSSNTLYINALNETETTVVATTTVNSSGVFTFPSGGTLLEGKTYILQLSKNQGTVGSPTPLKELVNGWITIGESSSSGISDGSPDGLLTITVGSNNSTDNTVNRFAVTTCAAGIMAPPVNTTFSVCSDNTVNLNTQAHTGTVPSGTRIVWHTSSSRTTGTEVTNPTSVSAGTYYASYYDEINNCYSPASSAITVTIAADNTVSSNATRTTCINTILSPTITHIATGATGIGTPSGLPAGLTASFASNTVIISGTPITSGTFHYSIPLTGGCQTVNATGTIIVDIDSDGDGISDYCDLDDDNDGILDADENECLNAIFATYPSSIPIITSLDFGVAHTGTAQINLNLSADISHKFGYPSNSGAVIVSIQSAHIHPNFDQFYVRGDLAPTKWEITGSVASVVGVEHGSDYFPGQRRTINMLNSAATPIAHTGITPGLWNSGSLGNSYYLENISGIRKENLGALHYASIDYTNNKNFELFTNETGESRWSTYFVRIHPECDDDKDGIPNRLDLDSDGDGCYDAIEGDENVLPPHLNADGSINGAVNSDGVPVLVNTGGAADIGNDLGQGAGNAYNALLNSCRNYWHGSTDSDWAKPENWTANIVPATGEDVEFATNDNNLTSGNGLGEAVRDLHLDMERLIGSLINLSTKKLVIPTAKFLTVDGNINTGGNNRILIQAAENQPNGSLVFANIPTSEEVLATVEMWSKAWIGTESEGNDKYRWQYFGIPVHSIIANPTFAGSAVRIYDEAKQTESLGEGKQWTSLANTSVLEKFKGYEITQPVPKKIFFSGRLVNDNLSTGELPVTEGSYYKGWHLLSNPYTAAIKVSDINFGVGMEKTVYLFTTGSFNDWRNEEYGNHGSLSIWDENSTVAPGQYLAIPQNLAGFSANTALIPSMQGFMVGVIPDAANGKTVNFNYSKLGLKGNSQPQRANRSKAETNYTYTTVTLTGGGQFDRVWLFTQAECTPTFDNGWDGPKITSSTSEKLQLSVLGSDDVYQIYASNSINDVYLDVKPAKENTDHTLHFHHYGTESTYSKIYLLDNQTGSVTDISADGTTYNFVTNGGEDSKRFKIITVNPNDSDQEETDITTYIESHSLFVHNRLPEAGNLYLYSLSGSLIASFPFAAENITSLPIDFIAGLYLLKIDVGTTQVNKKIVVGN